MEKRIPPSLAWLVDKRARLSGACHQLTLDIQKLEASLQQRKLTLERTENDLKAIDQTMNLHVVRVRPEVIPRIKPIKRGSPFPHGELNQQVLNALSEIDKPATISEVTEHIALKHMMNLDTRSMWHFRQTIRYALKGLRAKGRIFGTKVDGVLDASLWAVTKKQ